MERRSSRSSKAWEGPAHDPAYQPDRLTDFLETVKERYRFSQWFCGHYHTNRVIDGQFVVQWKQISKIETEEGQT